MFLKLKQEISG